MIVAGYVVLAAVSRALGLGVGPGLLAIVAGRGLGDR